MESLKCGGSFCRNVKDIGARTAITVPSGRMCTDACCEPNTKVLLKSSAIKSPETMSELQWSRLPPRPLPGMLLEHGHMPAAVARLLVAEE
eukprot:2924812-Pleurochrysis_carterae.AAC.1